MGPNENDLKTAMKFQVNIRPHFGGSDPQSRDTVPLLVSSAVQYVNIVEKCVQVFGINC
jgi:hypothetical protein